jgi:hypothetical protein
MLRCSLRDSAAIRHREMLLKIPSSDSPRIHGLQTYKGTGDARLDAA